MGRRHALTDEQWDTIKDLLPGKEGDPGRTAADNRPLRRRGPLRPEDRSPLGGPAEPLRKAELRLEAVRPLVPLGGVGADRGRPERPGPGGGPARLVQREGPSGRLDGPARAGRKRGGRRPTPPRAEPGRADDEDPRGGRPAGPAAASDPDGRPVRRRPAGRGPAEGLPEGGGRPRDRGRGVRQRRDPTPGEGDEVAGVHPAQPDAEGEEAVRPATLSESECDRRFFCGLKRCRRVATRYEKKAANFAGFVWLAALLVGGLN